MTAGYNRAMKEMLPQFNIALEEIPRLTNGGEVISATKVRRLLAEKKRKEFGKYVPQSTLDYLNNMQGL